MNEIERKVDMLISGMKLPKKKTRTRAVTIGTSLLIAIAIIASASLIDFYYMQTGTIDDVKCSITITPPGGTAQDTPWSDTATIGTIYAGDTYIYPGGTDFYTIAYVNPDTNAPKITVYIHVDVTETPVPVSPAVEGEGLTVVVWDVTSSTSPFAYENYPPQIELNPSQSVKFEIHITADPAIDHTSTYGYTMTMNWDGTI